ncbi:hypothetical protein [Methylobacterium indicum]|uniref:Secreted protein n=1 Tax=Methylobacterium indicum TaxID=1775910 RepID=A0ABR5HER9_9HYPH|nr:hypothetical protein [Methylobacterium indicum]KMO18903.1 hypothetical protein QR78_14450 [Methylobacterium indicum]KMO25061.1 hypothetical protein QR79_09840 [Methylobacterium indicum]
MIMRRLGLTALALVCAAPVLADPPPATAPPFRASAGSLVPTAIYKPDGSIWDPSTAPAASPVSLSATSATIALPQGTATQISNPGLKRFAVQVQGSGRVLIGFDNTVCSSGYRIDPPASSTSQGVIVPWYPANSGAYWACAPDTASSVFVERGQ